MQIPTAAMAFIANRLRNATLSERPRRVQSHGATLSEAVSFRDNQNNLSSSPTFSGGGRRGSSGGSPSNLTHQQRASLVVNDSPDSPNDRLNALLGRSGNELGSPLGDAQLHTLSSTGKRCAQNQVVPLPQQGESKKERGAPRSPHFLPGSVSEKEPTPALGDDGDGGDNDGGDDQPRPLRPPMLQTKERKQPQVREELPIQTLTTLQDEVACRWRLLVPSSRRRIFWDLFLVALVFWNMIVLPVDLAFKVQNGIGWSITESIIDMIFITDVVLNFM